MAEQTIKDTLEYVRRENSALDKRIGYGKACNDIIDAMRKDESIPLKIRVDISTKIVELMTENA